MFAGARLAWVHSGATSGCRIQSRSRGFTSAHLAVVGSFPDCVGSLGRTLLLSVSFVFAWVYSGAPIVGRVNSGSRLLTRARLGVVGFFQVRVVSLGRTLGWSGSFGCARIQSGPPSCHRVSICSVRRSSGPPISGSWVHSGVREFTLGITLIIRVRVVSLGRALGSPGLLRFEWVLSGAPRSRRYDWQSYGFTLVRQCVVGFIGVLVDSLVLV